MLVSVNIFSLAIIYLCFLFSMVFLFCWRGLLCFGYGGIFVVSQMFNFVFFWLLQSIYLSLRNYLDVLLLDHLSYFAADWDLILSLCYFVGVGSYFITTFFIFLFLQLSSGSLVGVVSSSWFICLMLAISIIRVVWFWTAFIALVFARSFLKLFFMPIMVGSGSSSVMVILWLVF